MPEFGAWRTSYRLPSQTYCAALHTTHYRQTISQLVSNPARCRCYFAGLKVSELRFEMSGLRIGIALAMNAQTVLTFPIGIAFWERERLPKTSNDHEIGNRSTVIIHGNPPMLVSQPFETVEKVRERNCLARGSSFGIKVGRLMH